MICTISKHAAEAKGYADALMLDWRGRVAEATGATVLLKGAVSVIAPPHPEAPLLAQDDATGYLATAGTGDVLAGILGAMLAAGLPGPEAAALAAIISSASSTVTSLPPYLIALSIRLVTARRIAAGRTRRTMRPSES